MIDRDAFEAWLAHPVTEFVMRVCEEQAEDLKESWVQYSWHGGVVDTVELAKLRAAHDAYMSLANMDFEIIEGRQDEQAVSRANTH